jgi:hypothetical protein
MYHPRMRAAVVALLAAAVAACGPTDGHVTLAPVPTVGGCGRPAGAGGLVVSALGDFAPDAIDVGLGAPVAIDSFPPETRQLAVAVLGAGGPLAVGASQPLQLGQLPDGAEVPILMAPQDGFCEVGPMAEARDRPLIVRAGAGALVIGGQGATGPSRSAEYYDPTKGTFTPVMVPTALGAMGTAGATATALADGRAVIVGGPSQAYGIFLPATGAFQTPAGALGEVRAYHAAVALDATRVLLAGGCSTIAAAGGCAAGSQRVTTEILDVDTGALDPGPALTTARIGGRAQLEATGADLTGPTGVLLTGGVDFAGAPVTAIERFDPAAPGTPAVATPGTGGLGAPLAAGAVLVALASPGAPAAGAAAVIAPGAAPYPVASATPRAGAVLVTLEDGTVAAIGGAAGTSVDRYLPAQRAWVATPAGAGSDAPDGIAGSAGVLLDDGTVLVAGGHDSAGQPQAGAWIYRPALGGPFQGAVTVTPLVGDDADATAQLDPLDPALVDTATGAWEIASSPSSGALASWAVIAGPELADGAVTATMRPTGGVAILLGFAGPSAFDAIVLPAGGIARLERHGPGGISPLCTGSSVPAALGGGTSVTFDVEREGDRVTATVTPQGEAATTVIDCAAGAGTRGKAGVAPVGAGANLIVDTIAVSR